MNVVILTTETLHHAYFVREMAKQADIELIVKETCPVRPKFETHHGVEDLREEYERNEFFGGDSPSSFDTWGPVLETPSVNDPVCVGKLAETRADLVIDFGTGKVSPDVINLFPDRILNLHGGAPERYRGLDSHLWAIYHRDFNALVTTIHHLNAELDCGDVILEGQVDVAPDSQLYQLRRFNTELCVQLAVASLDMLRRNGAFISHRQRKLGRYYSFMPAVLKDICVTRFERHFSTKKR